MITHKVSTVQVFLTEEYNNFSMITGNRGINTGKVAKIIKEIESGNDMLQYYPIQVRVNNEKLDILDGQHRFFISKKLKRPVHYIIVHEQKQMTDIARINSNVEKWKPQDFISCYVQQNNEHYIQLQAFLSQYKINIGTSVRLLSHGTPGTEGSEVKERERFEAGLFTVSKHNEAVTIAENAKKFAPFEYWSDRAFIIAIYRIMQAELVTIDELASTCSKYPGMLEKQHSYKAYINNLEQVFNKNKRKRTVIV
ncbi:MAG TPA: hypothetical protein P5519_10530 [Spirochaetia bacterium]|nr:hypothetical protein [Spirochaetia bacterium]